jgi:hypothetical protein
MDRDSAEKALMKLARQSAGSWARVRGETFRGVTILETSNTVYRFEDAVFSGRAKRQVHVATSAPIPWESPTSLAGLELMGFLSETKGLWSLSPRWRPRSLAVLWQVGRMTDDAFLLTSKTVACAVTPAMPTPTRPRVRPYTSVAAGRIPAAAPTVRRPSPPSMTKLRFVPSR